MKKIIEYSSIKYGWRLFLFLAVSGTWLLFVSQFSQWFNQVQVNEFGSALDVVIVYIAFAATLFILFVALLVGAGAGHLLGAIFEATIFAAIQMQRATIFSLGLVIHFSRLAVLQEALKQASRILNKYPQSLCIHLPLAKLTSLSKGPYSLFPLSCILLN